MTETKPRTIVLGFDALSRRYLDAFADDLPNLSALRTEGVEAPLRSTFPPWTGSAWPSMYTGTTPANHGVHGFFTYGGGYPDEAEIATRNDVKAPALWNYLSAEGVPSVVLNVPVTHPAEEVEGVLIPGYLAPADADGSPAGVRAELSDALGEEYRIYSPAESASGRVTDAEKLDGYLDLVRMRARAAAHLLSTNDWEFAFVQVQKTDAVFHNFDEREAFRRVYRAADELVGAVEEAVDGDVNVVVCSDHGIGPTTGYKVYVNEVLREHGYVTATAEGTTLSLGSHKAELVGEDEGAAGSQPTLATRAVTAVGSALSAVGVAPGDVYAAAERAGVASLVQRALPDGVGGQLGEHVDWRRSAAYIRNGSELGVRINLEGREPNGVVPADEYESVRDDLIDLLSGLETPDGEPAFEFVERREDVDDGPHVGDAPDVVFMPTEMNHTVATSLLGKRFVPVDTHEHKSEGVFIGSGPAFDPTADLDGLSLVDVAPIVMASLGRAVPERMTGKVPDGLLTCPTRHADYGDVQYGADTNDFGDGGEDDEMMDRLANLGYV